jgi:ASCH domain
VIFQHTHQLVLSGAKTQTRRPKKAMHVAVRATDDPTSPIIAVTQRGKLAVYTVGHTYAVQPARGRRALGFIRLTAIREAERAGDISEVDALAEGFATAAEWKAVYLEMWGVDALLEPCWVYEFKLERKGAS